MSRVHTVSAQLDEPAASIGAKARGLAELHRLGLPVPAAVVVTTEVCRGVLGTGRLPDGLVEEVTSALGSLPQQVSVRSGAADSMPGMMRTVLDVAVHPGGPNAPLADALREVFTSWDSPRARTYRTLHDIPHDRGTAAIVQVMVDGARDDHSGSGVAFSRDPNTGAPAPFGDVLFGHRGDDVVSGRVRTRPLGELAGREPAVWAALTTALDRAERRLRRPCYVEFTYESGRLWFLQLRPAQVTGLAALRIAVDLADDGLIDRPEAVRRTTERDLDRARTPTLAPTGADVVAGQGIGACPGVVSGRVATSADAAVRYAAGGPVVLVRPETSPHDMHGLAAAVGILTTRGGPACHAAVVARALGRPAVVGAADLDVDPVAGTVTTRTGTLAEGTVITIDGTTGQVVLGHAGAVVDDAGPHRDRLLDWADEISGDHTPRPGPDRLHDAHTALRTEENR
ncbi:MULTISPECIES: PEP/pyruvate-binding domain-containing protein [Pseudonocardia]|uniref:Pyruvate, phosphate dikinase n=2 Tax=Pseudonocardia TaxID=1847 RepID=A0A1Y2MT01_PSEAH|nr:MULTISPECIES: PEP/pyruvate-binding domain-containing protein [Pseudonocardia]OSY38340.1 Pyruvate, phosphate dikinase [Pseudonocardia autotrophica]TDN72615.1 pyruvate phosphate dikinase-like enzyme [Pseudonocardia autotrophica]BBG03324.1 hypothetical protein Pdca_45330 [Pseudonocardia autotrophica]GEC24582.1 hypothetical protein PSA01_16110 [Pseudonocardia saturnea]